MKKWFIIPFIIIFIIFACNGNGDEPLFDNIPPDVNITYPHNGQTFHTQEEITIKAYASDNVEVYNVHFKVYMVDGFHLVGSHPDYDEPYTYEWRTPWYPSSEDYEIYAIASDHELNTGIDVITITVADR